MAAVPETDPAPPPRLSLPGARTSCALLTLLTVLLAWPSASPDLQVVVRPAYFALLTWFFHRTARASPALHSSPMRLVRAGFLVLWLGFTVAAAVHFTGLERSYATAVYLRMVCEGGAILLLGITLLSYGLMLWIPQIVHSHRLLSERSARQEGALQQAASERSELERQLIEADRLGMLGELAASIAHDLRNPLTVVKGTAESLCRRPRSADEVREHTEVIRRNVDKASQTIESLIDLARPKTLTATTFAAAEALREVHELLHVEARRRGILLRVREPAVADAPALRTDRTMLAQVLLNLSLNALQACTTGAQVTLAARSRGGRVLLVVEDRGRGLPPDHRDRLFSPFFTTRTDGTGLGLTGCRRIARQLGGDVRLYPRHDGGARAVLSLPAANALPRAAAPVDEEGRCPATTC